MDQDELIQQEREKLRLLQEEWREKVRQSEIDISIERARVARLRAEIEDKVSNYETERAKNPLEGEGANLPDGTKLPVCAGGGYRDSGSRTATSKSTRSPGVQPAIAAPVA